MTTMTTMTKARFSKMWFAVPLALIALAPAAAFAKGDGVQARPNVQPVQPITLADNVVVTPTQAPAQQPASPTVVNPPPAPAPAPGPVVVTPTASAPAPAARSNSTVVEHENHNYVSTIFVSTLLGGLTGVLIGGAIWYLADDQTHTGRIGAWAAGGALVGAGIGVTQILVQESRVDRATAFSTDPAPTFRLALARVRF